MTEVHPKGRLRAAHSYRRGEKVSVSDRDAGLIQLIPSFVTVYSPPTAVTNVNDHDAHGRAGLPRRGGMVSYPGDLSPGVRRGCFQNRPNERPRSPKYGPVNARQGYG